MSHRVSQIRPLRAAEKGCIRGTQPLSSILANRIELGLRDERCGGEDARCAHWRCRIECCVWADAL